MKKTLALALAVIMICVCALTVSAAETTLPELDCSGWWTAHTEGVEITAEGVEITFTNTTYETAAENWNAPIWILYTGDEAKVNGAGYNEYWVHRADNYGWAGAWGNFVNTGDMAAVNALGVTVEATLEAGCWDNWVADLKAGHECVVTGILEGTNAIISIKCHGVTNTVTIPVDAEKPVYLSLSGELTKLSNIKVITPEEEPAGEPKTITIGDRTFTAAAGKWVYNTAVTKDNAATYSMIIFDKAFEGSFETNGWGAAIVLDQYGTLVKIYDGANGGFWTEAGKSTDALTFGTGNFAVVAFNELQEGETLIIFPNDGVNDKNSARSFALGLRNAGTENPCECGKTATLEGFTFAEKPVDPEPTEPETEATTAPAATETVKPTTPVNPGTGDNSPVMLAVGMMMAAACLIVLVQKKRAV